MTSCPRILGHGEFLTEISLKKHGLLMLMYKGASKNSIVSRNSEILQTGIPLILVKKEAQKIVEFSL